MLKRLEIVGFKSFAKKTVLDFSHAATAIVGPNGSGKSNVAEAFRFALGEQSIKSMRGKRTEDLIWGGSNALPRASRASVVIVFDNARRMFNLDFDEVSIERAVFRDGASEYSINGSRVRLRDVEELLASAHIGETGHHIISQGEADRILLASPRERRAMLEDALGLRVYEFKKQEAERKLLKTEENIAHVHSLRRELAPHLRFLEKQVEKLERADALRLELETLSQTYLACEEAYLTEARTHLAVEKRDADERLAVATAELSVIEERATTDAEGAERLEVVRAHERELETLREERSTLARSLGRIEGALTAAKERTEKMVREPYAKIPREDLSLLQGEVAKQSEGAKTPEALLAALHAVHTLVKTFVERFVAPGDELFLEEERAVQTLEEERKDLGEKDTLLAEKIEKLQTALLAARGTIIAHDETGKELHRRILALAQTKAREEAAVARAEAREHEIMMGEAALEEEKRELFALVGAAGLSYRMEDAPKEERRLQEERKRTLERMKIRLEEAGGTGEEIRHEHKEVSEREAFLARELEDLAHSAAGLRNLIDELTIELSKHFSEGLTKVNRSFNEYFALMFGGGSARLTLEEPDREAEDEDSTESDDEEKEEKSRKEMRAGIEISVSLPKKKVRALMQLSGGERALTSIALIFAMSQVNPPPFLILDETDAALDEANSRRYGDMIENLVKHSQLIVITHNRETMSRTGLLYGVTMGSDGISKLLSVKFEEAVAVAK
jgi:chromosome segregation protein